jgi:hypothetical protein
MSKACASAPSDGKGKPKRRCSADTFFLERILLLLENKEAKKNLILIIRVAVAAICRILQQDFRDMHESMRRWVLSGSSRR